MQRAGDGRDIEDVWSMLGARVAQYGNASMRVEAVQPHPTEASTVCWSFVPAQGPARTVSETQSGSCAQAPQR